MINRILKYFNTFTNKSNNNTNNESTKQHNNINVEWMETAVTAVIDSEDELEEGDIIYKCIDDSKYVFEITATNTGRKEVENIGKVQSIDGRELGERRLIEF